MIRAVIDTNIVVSAFFWGGLPRAALDAARAKRFRMITTEALIDELKVAIGIARAAHGDAGAQVGQSDYGACDGRSAGIVHGAQDGARLELRQGHGKPQGEKKGQQRKRYKHTYGTQTSF